VELEAERERLSKKLVRIKDRIARSEALLAGEFAHRAPAHVVQREQDKLADLQTEEGKLRERLAALG
jgi:valyl-tRNA synthetase